MNSAPLRLVLTAEQSAAIRESGIRFAIIHPDSYPSPHVGKWVVDLLECDVYTANAACRVAMGLSKERRPKAATARPQEQTDGTQQPSTTGGVGQHSGGNQ